MANARSHKVSVGPDSPPLLPEDVEPVAIEDGTADLTADEARALTAKIKAGVAAVWELIKLAYTRRAWIAMGYESWDLYCIKEFGSGQLKIPREERAEIVTSLRHAGLSIPAITSATGLGVGTVHREIISSGFPNGKPDGGALDAGVTDTASEPTRIKGRDGKSYPAKPKRPKPRINEATAGINEATDDDTRLQQQVDLDDDDDIIEMTATEAEDREWDFWRAGYTAGRDAAFGLRPGQVALVVREANRLRTLTLVLDPDNAAHRAALQLAAELSGAQVQ